MIEHILATDRDAEARAAAPSAADPIPQTVAEELTNVIRRNPALRDRAKKSRRFLEQAMGRR